MLTHQQAFFLCLSLLFTSLFPPALSAQELLVPYRVGDLLGYADLDGNQRIDAQFEKAFLFDKNGYARVENDGQVALIDSTGKLMTFYAEQYPEGKTYFDELGRRGTGYYTKFGDYTTYVGADFQSEFECPFYLYRRLGRVAQTEKRENRKRYSTIVDDNCNLLLPFSEDRTWLFTMEGRAKRPLIAKEHKDGTLVYDDYAKPFLDSIYDRVRIVEHKDQRLFVLMRNDEMDIVSDELEVLYENLTTAIAFDEQAFGEFKQKTGLSSAIIVKLLELNKTIRCFVSRNNDCVCSTSRFLLKGSFMNGKNLLAEGENIRGWNFKRTYFIVSTPEGKDQVKNIQGEYIELSEAVDTIISDVNFTSIIAKQGEGYAFFDLEGNKLNDFLAVEYNDWKVRQEGNVKYAYHDRNGVPLTDFIYTDIDRTIRQNRFLAKTPNGYTILDSIGTTLLNIACDTIYRFNRKSWYWTVEIGDKMGIYNSDGELIAPVQYDSIKMTGLFATTTGFRAYRDGVPSLYSPKGQALDLAISDRLKHEAKLGFWSTGHFRIYDKEENKNYFFTPEGDLLTTRIVDGGELHGRGKEHHLFILGGSYINYTTGVYYRKEE